LIACLFIELPGFVAVHPALTEPYGRHSGEYDPTGHEAVGWQGWHAVSYMVLAQ
jgi:hypothetical protein